MAGNLFVEWIMEKIPDEAKYQVVHFNEKRIIFSKYC